VDCPLLASRRDAESKTTLGSPLGGKSCLCGGPKELQPKQQHEQHTTRSPLRRCFFFSSDDSDDYEDDGSMDDISMDEEELAAQRQRQRDEEMHRIETNDIPLSQRCAFAIIIIILQWWMLGPSVGTHNFRNLYCNLAHQTF